MRSSSLLVVLLILLGISSMSLFTVHETDKAIIMRLGKLLTEETNNDSKPRIYAPGLHMKIPLIDTVQKFDTRAHILDVKSNKVKTAEKKVVEVDFYVQWRIEDLALYYRRTGGLKTRAEALLQDKAFAGLVIEFGKLTIPEVVSSERVELMSRLLKSTDSATQGMGMEVLDVRIKRINFPDEVSASVYNRMRAERERIANEYRAEGRKEAITLRSQAEWKHRVILAEADKRAKELMGEGDSQAIEIYARAYNKSPDFYRFYRSLEAYRNTFKDKGDILVLKPDSDFFKYFSGAKD